MKYLIVVLVVAGVLWWLLSRPGRVTKARTRGTAPQAATEMVVCAHCGVHLPAPDAVRDGARHFCSEAHRLAGPREPDRR